ncbi:MAG TPA: hypothetical protein VGD76_13095, partial [Ramlibacter sp.]
MRKATMLGLLAFAAGAAQAGTYSVLQENDCKLVTPGQLQEAIHQAGKDTGLDLPRGMALRAELHCTRDANSKRFVYTIRAAIEKLVNDGEQQRWAQLAHLTGYGTTATAASLLREVRF